MRPHGVDPPSSPACVTTNATPAIVIVPWRVLPRLRPAAKLTVPFPVPLAPAVIVIQVSGVVAVQAHPAGIVTATDPLPPRSVNE